MEAVERAGTVKQNDSVALNALQADPGIAPAHKLDVGVLKAALHQYRRIYDVPFQELGGAADLEGY